MNCLIKHYLDKIVVCLMVLLFRHGVYIQFELKFLCSLLMVDENKELSL